MKTMTLRRRRKNDQISFPCTFLCDTISTIVVAVCLLLLLIDSVCIVSLSLLCTIVHFNFFFPSLSQRHSSCVNDEEIEPTQKKSINRLRYEFEYDACVANVCEFFLVVVVVVVPMLNFICRTACGLHH